MSVLGYCTVCHRIRPLMRVKLWAKIPLGVRRACDEQQVS